MRFRKWKPELCMEVSDGLKLCLHTVWFLQYRSFVLSTKRFRRRLSMAINLCPLGKPHLHLCSTYFQWSFPLLVITFKFIDC